MKCYSVEQSSAIVVVHEKCYNPAVFMKQHISRPLPNLGQIYGYTHAGISTSDLLNARRSTLYYPVLPNS